MPLALLMLLQAAQPPAPAARAPIDFDLAKVSGPDVDGLGRRRCRPAGEPQSDNDIVVCGRRGSGAYPIEEMEGLFRQKPLMAEVSLGGGTTGRAYVESVDMPAGHRSKRIMFGIKTPF